MRLFLLPVALLTLLISHGCQQSEPTAPTENPKTPEPAIHKENGPANQSTEAVDVDPVIRFVDVSAKTGITFCHVSGDSDQKPFPAANGSGVAAFDYDLDGWIDLYFLNGTTFPISEEPRKPNDAFYRNRMGWSFSDVTEFATIGSIAYSAGAVSGDFNSDGLPDVFVNCYGDDRFYINMGDGTFQENARHSGISDPSWGTSAAALDFDNDGDLDLYVCNYAEWTWENNVFCGDRTKNIRIFCSPRTVKPVADKLFENLGDGQFCDALKKAGMDREPARGQGVVAADIDNDGLVDLYVGNDINTNSLFRNKGDSSFEDLTNLSGAGVDFAGQIQAGMGVDIADIDRDGLVEVFVTNYEGEHNAFYQNLGNNVFQDTSQSKGLAAPSMKWVGWGTKFTDFDLDGWVDLVITNGHTDNNLQQLGRDSMYEQPPLLFRNQNGRLMPIESSSNSYFATRHPGRSLCVADLDQDCDPDIVMGHKDQTPAVLENVSKIEQGKIALVLSFVGTVANRDGVGVGVELLGGLPIVRDQIKSGGSYLASHPYTITLCLPDNQLGELTVRWSNGETEQLTLPIAKGHYTAVQGRRSFFRTSPN